MPVEKEVKTDALKQQPKSLLQAQLKAIFTVNLWQYEIHFNWIYVFHSN